MSLNSLRKNFSWITWNYKFQRMLFRVSTNFWGFWRVFAGWALEKSCWKTKPSTVDTLYCRPRQCILQLHSFLSALNAEWLQEHAPIGMRVQTKDFAAALSYGWGFFPPIHSADWATLTKRSQMGCSNPVPHREGSDLVEGASSTGCPAPLCNQQGSAYVTKGPWNVNTQSL